MIDKIHIYISLFAALVATIVCIILKTPLVLSVSRLVFFIILFYFVGLIIKFYLKSKVFSKKETTIEVSPEETEN